MLVFILASLAIIMGWHFRARMLHNLLIRFLCLLAYFLLFPDMHPLAHLPWEALISDDPQHTRAFSSLSENIHVHKCRDPF